MSEREDRKNASPLNFNTGSGGSMASSHCMVFLLILFPFGGVTGELKLREEEKMFGCWARMEGARMEEEETTVF